MDEDDNRDGDCPMCGGAMRLVEPVRRGGSCFYACDDCDYEAHDL